MKRSSKENENAWKTGEIHIRSVPVSRVLFQCQCPGFDRTLDNLYHVTQDTITGEEVWGRRTHGFLLHNLLGDLNYFIMKSDFLEKAKMILAF